MAVGPYVQRALIAARKLDLTRDDRHDLAEYLTGHEGSWSTMTEDDGRRVGDALVAYPAVQWLHQDRPRRWSLPRPALRHRTRVS